MRDQAKSPSDYIWGVWRRKWLAISLCVLIFSVAASIALYLPPVYRSTATVLIEGPGLPTDMVDTTISTYAAQRLESIRQRILSSRTLADLIDRMNLYPDLRAEKPMTEAVQAFRQSMELELVSADVNAPGSRRLDQATIAFRLSFDYEEPGAAQRVTNELVSLFLAENLRERRESAAEARNFLSEEVDRLEEQIRATEAKLADFKREHAGELPGELNINQQLVLRTEQSLSALDNREQLLKEREVYLQSQLAQIEPVVSSAATAEQQLDALRAEFVRLQGRYGEAHPDVKSLKREIDALEKETGYYGNPNSILQQLEAARNQLAVAKEAYAVDHPDVQRLERQVDSLTNAYSRAKASQNRGAEGASNPAYIQVQTQLAALRSELQSIREQRGKLREDLRTYEKRLLATPEVERKYLDLKRDYDNAQLKYNELKSKLLQAQVAESLEAKRMGERFSLIDPPQFPHEPAKPNRIGIMVLGLLLSVAGGIGITLALEAVDPTLRGRGQLASIVGASPLVVVPYIETQADKVRQWSLRAAVSLTIVMLMVGGLVAMNLYLAPLDILWLQAIDRIGF